MNPQHPNQGQPFQPPAPGQPHQPSNQAPPQYQAGPPPNASSGRTTLWPAAVIVLATVALGASYWMGTYLAVYGRNGVRFYLLGALPAFSLSALSRSV